MGDDQIDGDMQDVSAEPSPIMAPTPEINNCEEPAANKIEPEQGAAVNASKEQPVIVVDEPNNIDDDEQRRYPIKT